MSHQVHITTTGNPTETSRDSASAPLDSPTNARGPLAAIWNCVTAVIATVAGLAPHVLHHIGLFAGAAFVVGFGGNLLFGAAGLLLSLPLLRRLHRRFGTWKAPAAAVAVLTVMFSISAFVVGPAISRPEPVGTPQLAGTENPAEHGVHHND